MHAHRVHVHGATPHSSTDACDVAEGAQHPARRPLHRKGRFWVQFGGHLEPGDRSLADAARREAREESGIADLDLLDTSIADLDRHDLNGGFACAAHRDVGFVAVVEPARTTTVSEESDDVRWFALDALPEGLAPGLPARLAAVVTTVAHRD